MVQELLAVSTILVLFQCSLRCRTTGPDRMDGSTL